ncbi:MAG: AAA family ATPase [Patescibacteria group bacterium]|nr:AAA family ATPase [Patescibacteria group bacterium]
MHLKRLEISGFKSFARKVVFEFDTPVCAIVGPNGSGKSNIAEAIRFVLGEQSMKSLRSKRGEDLIWNGGGAVGRSNHADVTIVFDNTKNEFELDYDEVALKRSVSRDGENQYFINNSQVRLRDIFELLGKIHIGATGHHIISQGEADRILNANIKERRSMIEEALGLRVHQWKIEESEKKLAKTEENIKQVESLRREIAPHIRFLKKQVERVERAKEMREDLKGLYAEYLKRENEYLTAHRARLAEERTGPERELKDLEGKLAEARLALSSENPHDGKSNRLVLLEQNISAARTTKDELSRSLGRIEGMIEFEERRLQKARDQHKEVEVVAYRDVKGFTEDLEEQITQALAQETIEGMRSILQKARGIFSDFLARIQHTSTETPVDVSEQDSMKKEKSDIEGKLTLAVKEVQKLGEVYEALKEEIEKEKDSSRETEKTIFKMMAQKSELAAMMTRIRGEEERIAQATAAFQEEIREGVALIGRDITLYENFAIVTEEVLAEDRTVQEERRKHIEKVKIKLEDMGAGGAEEILKEYEEITERDTFLEREIEDLEKSAASLRGLIIELSLKLDTDFKEGITKINKQFHEFFTLMFGGGGASLSVVAQKKRKRSDASLILDEDMPPPEEEEEEGIDINVSLPRKKIKGLAMLSGGERALTSIALIFAISQVNPPPFLVLDETDAALDEANSRKYGDMLENLSKHSQLVVVTHNRETMSRAQVIYGVTMDADAVSKLLSVRFDEAAAYAK